MERTLDNRDLIDFFKDRTSKRSIAVGNDDNFKETDKAKIITWIKNISVSISLESEKEFEYLLEKMKELAEIRERLHFLFYGKNIEFFRKIRESMEKIFVVLSELRVERKEFIPYWFSEDYWVNFWSQTIFKESPESTLSNIYGINIKIKDLIKYLVLELVTADSASKLDKPMIIKVPDDDTQCCMLIPSLHASKVYEETINKILNGKFTISEWLNVILTDLNNWIIKNFNKSKHKIEKRLFKIVMVGDIGVGKTSIRKKYFDEGYLVSEGYSGTFGVDFAVHDNSTITWQIWDLTGQPSFKNVLSSYFNRILGAIMVFDLTRPSTFDNIEKWLSQIEKHSGRNKRVPIILVGNKADLQDKRVSSERINKFVEKNNLVYIETSASSNENIEQIYKRLSQQIIEYTAVKSN